jgi:uncharacterized protein (DUF58 family)
MPNFYTRKPANSESVTLTVRRIGIVPSKRGFGFILLLILLLLIAFVYNNNLAYLLTFLLASVFFITIIHTYHSLAGLVLKEGQCKHVFVGEAAGFDIHIHNPTAVERFNLHIHLEKTANFTLPAQSKTAITLYEIAQKRGWQTIGKVTLSTTYPLGLFYAWSPIRFDSKALIYPKPATMEIPFPETLAADTTQGVSYKGVDDFYGLQDYQAGDSIRHIHWKAFAKGQGLFSKQYSGAATSAEVWLHYDYAAGHNTEERLSQLCRWVIDAEQADIRYGLVLPNLTLIPDCGAAHYRQCLEALALL